MVCRHAVVAARACRTHGSPRACAHYGRRVRRRARCRAIPSYLSATENPRKNIACVRFCASRKISAFFFFRYISKLAAFAGRNNDNIVYNDYRCSAVVRTARGDDVRRAHSCCARDNAPADIYLFFLDFSPSLLASRSFSTGRSPGRRHDTVVVNTPIISLFSLSEFTGQHAIFE